METELTIKKLFEAIQSTELEKTLKDERFLTYLATYPAILKFASGESTFDSDRFYQLATMTYGWMPRILRIDTSHVDHACAVLNQAKKEKKEDYASNNICDIAKRIAIVDLAKALYSSLVGASKMLHFVNPKVFPIWDGRVEWLRVGGEKKPNNPHMTTVGNYWEYFKIVHGIRLDTEFKKFYRSFCAKLPENPKHPANGTAISDVRAVELAAFIVSPSSAAARV